MIAPVEHEQTGLARQTQRLTAAGLFRSEWIKFSGVRSTIVLLSSAVVLTIGLGVLLALVDGSGSASDPLGRIVGPATTGAQLATLIVAIIGARVTAAEYSTGLIRVTMAGAPRRLPVLWAKAAVVVTAVGGALGAALLLTFVVARSVLAGSGPVAGLDDPELWGLFLGNVLVLVVVSLVGMGLGAVTRSTVGAFGALVVLLFIVPLLVPALPDFPGRQLLNHYNLAGATIAVTTPDGGDLGGASVFGSLIALLLWTAVVLGAAALAVRRRDV